MPEDKTKAWKVEYTYRTLSGYQTAGEAIVLGRSATDVASQLPKVLPRDAYNVNFFSLGAVTWQDPPNN